MLRRVARVLRVGLLGAGLAVFVWWPVSLVTHVYYGNARGNINVEAGSIHGKLIRRPTPGFTGSWSDIDFRTARIEDVRFLARPRLETSGGQVTGLVLPLWLLAFLCLAWPVTSFLIARRRRRGRGFDVELRDSAHA